MRSKLILAPFQESPPDYPVSVTEAKTHARIEGNTDDTRVETLIRVASQYAQERTSQALGLQIWEVELDAFPCDYNEIALPLAPVVSVEFISYVDFSGNRVELDADMYFVKDYGPQHSICPKYNAIWPVSYQPGSIRIRYTCGYHSGASPDMYNIPDRLKQGLLMLITEMYDARSADALALDDVKRSSIDWLLRPSARLW
jgi:uncharacterized phiE125 gp8 family phage protein